jgi:hypothetical protein
MKYISFIRLLYLSILLWLFLVSIDSTFAIFCVPGSSDYAVCAGMNQINMNLQNIQIQERQKRFDQMNSNSYSNTYIPPSTEVCIKEYGQHMLWDEKNQYCTCENWYTVSKNKQCVMSSVTMACKKERGIHAIWIDYWPFAWNCTCENWYLYLVEFTGCTKWSTLKEICQNKYWINTSVKFTLDKKWEIIFDTQKCICNEWYKLIEEKCIETTWHKIKIFWKTLR